MDGHGQMQEPNVDSFCLPNCTEYRANVIFLHTAVAARGQYGRRRGGHTYSE